MSDWSHAEDHKVLKMWCAYNPPFTVREIADDLERTKSSVDRRIAALGIRGHKGDLSKYEQETGIAVDPIIKPVRVDRPVRPSGMPTGSEYITLVWGDVHYPFQNDAAVDILYQITEYLEPEKIICLGDVFDFWELAPEFRDPRDSEPDIMLALEQGVAHLSQMIDLSACDKAIFLGGNHEDRWDRMLEKARKDIRFRQIMRLPKIRRSMDFEEVVGFDDLGYEYRPYVEAEIYIENDMLVITHGTRAPKHAAAAMIGKYGKSVIFGHTHHIQNFTQRDLRGQDSAWNIGCLSVLDPHYDHFANWAHGFAVVTWHRQGSEWLYNVEQVRIHDGVCVFRDKVYKAS